MKTFDMQLMRYMNLFTGVTRVSANHCFKYNNMIVFVVSGNLVPRALGRDNSNLKRLSDIIGKRIRVLAEPRSNEDLKGFAELLVYPVTFEKIDIVDSEDKKDKDAVITAGGRENKAMLIGRDRIRETELREILEQYFGTKGLKII